MGRAERTGGRRRIPHGSFRHLYARTVQVLAQPHVQLVEAPQLQIGHGLLLVLHVPGAQLVRSRRHGRVEKATDVAISEEGGAQGGCLLERRNGGEREGPGGAVVTDRTNGGWLLGGVVVRGLEAEVPLRRGGKLATSDQPTALAWACVSSQRCAAAGRGAR